MGDKPVEMSAINNVDEVAAQTPPPVEDDDDDEDGE